MKTKNRFLVVCTLLALGLSPTLGYAQNHDHPHEKKVAGPNGGRIIEGVEPHAEFFVTEDRHVHITFLTDEGKPIAPAGQVVKVTAGDRAAPTHLAFTRQGNALVSDRPLPGGNDFPTVVQLKATPEAKVVYEKFNLNLALCGKCKLGEYACICDEHEH